MENSRDELDRDWLACKHILCIRADHMGDLLMSTPAIAALKGSIRCRITLLTSTKAAAVARLIPDIDHIIVADLQWMKLNADPGPLLLQNLIKLLTLQKFDGCVIFSVYSQQTIAAAMLAYLAGIPLRLAYSRENPYYLLTHWVPDPEPYFYISHQVERDMDLVRMIGAVVQEKSLRIHLSDHSLTAAIVKASSRGINLLQPYIILHPGVSEDKRKYPEQLWVSVGQALVAIFGVPILITGSEQESALADGIATAIGNYATAVAGWFDLEEFGWVIKKALTLVSVNTGTIHLAAAIGKPLVVLYAQTNPQHTPWMVRCKILEYTVPEAQRSKNQVVAFVNKQYYTNEFPYPTAIEVVNAVKALLNAEK